MKFGQFVKVFLVTIVLLVVIAGGCTCTGYNRAVGLDEEVKSAWAQVENQLQRRFDLVPNLEATVKGLTKQEQDIYLGVAKARESYFQAKNVGEKAQAAGTFESALSRLLVLKETYPELRSDQAFLKLQDAIEGTENRLSTERKRFNEAVRELNTFTRTFTGRLYASLANVGKAEYFDVAEAAKTAPKIDFSSKTGG